MNYGESILSKTIDENSVLMLTQNGVTEVDFVTKAERAAYRFIIRYAAANKGQAPDFRTVTAEVEGFNYVPNVSDSFSFLAKELKNYAGRIEVAELFNGKTDERGKFIPSEIATQFEEADNTDIFLDWLINRSQSIKMRTSVRESVGTDLKKDAASFLEEFKLRKEGKAYKMWKSKFETINQEAGPYMSGNMFAWYGRPGRGKSVYVMIEAIEAAMQGARVLIWALEMSKYEWLSRAYSVVSAYKGIAVATVDGVDYEAGFDSKALLTGQLDEEIIGQLAGFLNELNELIPGEIILRAVDDYDFSARGCEQLEADIVAAQADVVVIDPIYYMDTPPNTSRTPGGEYAALSKKLRYIAGKTSVVMHVITQADETKDERNEDNERELRPPTRSELGKTKAILQDSVNIFAIDTLDGRGIVEIGKGRNGGEGTQVETIYLPNFGIVQELPTGAEAAEQFDGF